MLRDAVDIVNIILPRPDVFPSAPTRQMRASPK
jgi:hypothetical protein